MAKVEICKNVRFCIEHNIIQTNKSNKPFITLTGFIYFYVEAETSYVVVCRTNENR